MPGTGTVRLLERRYNSVESQELLQYANLSHCWGLSQITRLLTDNIAQLHRGIDIDTLQPTFRHAIRVVRMLGLRHLWIDSLCIIQDSAVDWGIESALMGSVYGHASVNLAATSSSNARGGLFFDRDPIVVQPFAAYSPPSFSHQSSKMFESGWYVWKNDARWGRVGDEPLNRRGWVLQERLLSARTVHFTKSEIVWHCLENLGSESVPEQVQNALLAMLVMKIGDYTDIRIAIATLRNERRRLSLLETKARLYQDWRRVLVHYSKCGLTKEKDKLIAIFGIARTWSTCLRISVLQGCGEARCHRAGYSGLTGASRTPSMGKSKLRQRRSSTDQNSGGHHRGVGRRSNWSSITPSSEAMRDVTPGLPLQLWREARMVAQYVGG